jgi:hypothetical protein
MQFRVLNMSDRYHPTCLQFPGIVLGRNTNNRGHLPEGPMPIGPAVP